MTTTARLARLVAAAIRPGVLRWRKYWDVDHRAVNFYPNDEAFAEALEQQKEAFDRNAREQAHGYARKNVLPRIRFDISKGLNGFSLEAPPGVLRGDLLSKCVLGILAQWRCHSFHGHHHKLIEMRARTCLLLSPRRNPIAFHLMLGLPLVLWLAVAWAAMHWYTLPKTQNGLANSSSMINRNVLNKRIELLEEKLDVQRRGELSPAAAAAAAKEIELPPEQAAKKTSPSRLFDKLSTVFSAPTAVPTTNTLIAEPFKKELAALRKEKADVIAAAADLRARIETEGELASTTAKVPTSPSLSAVGAGTIEELEHRISRLEAAIFQSNALRSGEDVSGNTRTSGGGDSASETASDSATTSVVSNCTG